MTAHPYDGSRAALATKHGKLALIGPVMFRRLGLVLETAEVDTDALGTFSGEVPRRGSQLEVAEAKARLGTRATGLDIGFASEGTFGPYWGVPFLTADIEVVTMVDDSLGIVVSETEVDFDVVSFGADMDAPDIATLGLERAGFPEHGLIVRSQSGSGPIVKGIHDPEDLARAVQDCHSWDPSAGVRVESDFRAHHHPSRRRVIARAAERLANRLAQLCPACAAPGWGIGRHEGGAPCRDCGNPTRMIRREFLICARCDVEMARLAAGSSGVDPQYCPRCNP